MKSVAEPEHDSLDEFIIQSGFPEIVDDPSSVSSEGVVGNEMGAIWKVFSEPIKESQDSFFPFLNIFQRLIISVQGLVPLLIN